MEKKGKSDTKSNTASLLIMGMSAAILLVSPVLCLLLIGYFVDKFFHTTPIFILCGLTIAFISGIINVFKVIKVMQRQKKQALQ